MAGYQKLEVLIREEVDELIEEGRAIDRDETMRRIDACGTDKEKLNTLYDALMQTPYRSDFPYREPTAWEEIAALSEPYQDGEKKDIPLNYFHGAWLGRCIGCAMGQPVELWKGEDIRSWYRNAGKYPIDGFVPTHSGENVNNGAATDENICGMPMDDDIRFTVLGYLLLQKKGADFDTFDVGDHWMRSLPFRYICTAENQAYMNFVNVDSFGPWGKPENAMQKLLESGINTYRNPYREWIGAQIRIDAYAYCAAGQPAKAALWAYRDAFLSHIKNGVYSAMFFSAMIASAFTVKDIDACFETALSFVPKTSRFYEAMLTAREIGRTAETREEIDERIQNGMRKYNVVHSINNSALCVASIFHGKGDFAEAVCTALSGGMDTDCNCATVGSFMGALVGASGIPERFAAPMRDTFSSGITGFDNASILGFAEKCRDLRERI